MVTKERINSKVKALAEKYTLAIQEVQKIEAELLTYKELSLQLDDRYIRVNCPQCGGRGYIKSDDKKIECNMCAGKLYVWMEAYTPPK